jgi:hypothetical protein
VDRLAYPLHRPMTCSRLLRRQGLPKGRRLVLSRQWVAIFVRGEGGSFPGHRYLLKVLSSLVHVHRILHSKGVLTRRCSSPGKTMMLFRHVPQVQRRQVRVRWVPYLSTRCQGAWVPTTTSHRDRCLRLTLPETHEGRCLSASGSPRACRGPGPLLG